MNIVIWIVVALVAGVLAGSMMSRGGYGRAWDVALGLTGSIVVSWLFELVRWDSPEPGLLAVAIVASLGAGSLIAAQRTIFPARGWTPHMDPSWRADPERLGERHDRERRS
ncbi:MAG TPA: GlsB/YeaQ/YmgE family stress response membrane protein [Methylomirabilota bacterium]|jgi:uncharacterized membrane protein YeaQ/YmgE (transglycosylase-associated protein family)|nr:GlsB/YeaQ/YmgE family stress response membrane protein [Methylomirabilota bacterium]